MDVTERHWLSFH